jgi:hypothetical protein
MTDEPEGGLVGTIQNQLEIDDDVEFGTEPRQIQLDHAWETSVPPFSNPPTPHEIEKYFGDALIDAWKAEFESVCWNTPGFAEQSLHVIVGRLPSVRDMSIHYNKNHWDGRFHGVLFQRSGTGKGRGYNLAITMMEKLEIHAVKGDSVTDARLLGSIKFDEQGNERRIPGYLDPESGFDVLVLNEATLMLDTKKTDYQKDFLNYFQIAMNTINTPDNVIEKSTNDMQGEMIRINPTISFFFTTYPPKNLLDTIIKSGFLPRMHIIYNSKSFAERENDWERMANSVGKRSEVKIDDIAHALKYVANFYKGKTNDIVVNAEAQSFSWDYLKKISGAIKNVNSVVREQLADFVPRVFEQVVKVAYHHAMLRLSMKVENEDYLYALAFIMPSWNGLVTYLEDSDEFVKDEIQRMKSQARDCYSVYDKLLKIKGEKFKETGKDADAWIPLDLLVNLLDDPVTGWDKTRNTIRNRIKKLIQLGYFDKRENENKKVFLKRAM